MTGRVLVLHPRPLVNPRTRHASNPKDPHVPRHARTPPVSMSTAACRRTLLTAHRDARACPRRGGLAPPEPPSVTPNTWQVLAIRPSSGVAAPELGRSAQIRAWKGSVVGGHVGRPTSKLSILFPRRGMRHSCLRRKVSPSTARPPPLSHPRDRPHPCRPASPRRSHGRDLDEERLHLCPHARPTAPRADTSARRCRAGCACRRRARRHGRPTASGSSAGAVDPRR